MRSILLIAALVCPLPAAAAERSYSEEFYDARKIKKSDPAGAADGMLRSFHLAVTAGNADFATAAGASACYLIYGQGKVMESGKLAREVIDALEPLDAKSPDGDALRRVQLFNFLERGLLMEGRIGPAWQANRAAAETLRGKKVPSNADGPSITVGEVIRLAPEFRSLGWLLIERESELLDHVGRSVEARALLDEAAGSFGKDWRQRLAPAELFYAFKLLAARAMLLDFLGFKRDALQAQQELLAIGEDIPHIHPSYLTLRLNRLRNLSKWDGPSEEILEQAQKAAAELKASGPDRGTDRLLAKMELDLRSSQEALDALRADAKKNADLGAWMDATYSGRDSLMARANLGENGLDAEFNALLKEMRAHGNKCGEPTLYREYGNYLLERDRPAEAIAMFTECLRLTRSFGWTLHEPALLNALFNARFAAGDLAGARATLAELVAFLIAHPDLPDFRRVPAEVSRAIALARLGDKDAARAALKLARELAKDLPECQKRWLAPGEETRLIPDGPEPSAAAVIELPPLHLQPLEIVSIAPPGDPARTRFVVFNPTARGIQGRLEIHGPGAVANDVGDAATFTAGRPATTLRLPRTVAAGGEADLDVSLTAGAGIEAAQVRVAWENPGRSAGPAATWNVSWDPAAAGSVVLDASSLEANPFRSVSLFHELAVPEGELNGIPFRLRSPVALRFEYYDSASQALLAIDANGNGDFTEPGDLHIRGPEGVTSAIFPIPPSGKTLTVEVHVFAPDGLPLVPGKSALVLDAEVYRHGTSTKQAEDTLK